MNSIIEKVTLYDFFGYFVPGLTFVSFIFMALIDKTDEFVLTLFKNYSSICWMATVLAGFIFGIILSEIARILSDLIDSLQKSKYAKIVLTKLKIDIRTIGYALEKGGLSGSADAVTENNFTDYLLGMYGSIQVEEKYKRIHNYSSSVMMYKNLSVAILIGGAMFFYIVQDWSRKSIIIWIIAVVILVHRYSRIKVRKDVYTIVWFVDKYSKTTPNKKLKKR